MEVALIILGSLFGSIVAIFMVLIPIRIIRGIKKRMEYHKLTDTIGRCYGILQENNVDPRSELDRISNKIGVDARVRNHGIEDWKRVYEVIYRKYNTPEVRDKTIDYILNE